LLTEDELADKDCCHWRQLQTCSEVTSGETEVRCSGDSSDARQATRRVRSQTGPAAFELGFTKSRDQIATEVDQSRDGGGGSSLFESGLFLSRADQESAVGARDQIARSHFNHVSEENLGCVQRIGSIARSQPTR
jgi:hypothetical protein